jgi:hypothetical protein
MIEQIVTYVTGAGLLASIGVLINVLQRLTAVETKLDLFLNFKKNEVTHD